MARIRSFKPEIFSDDKVDIVSDAAFRLWLCTWCEADDTTGCFDARPAYLKSRAFPMRCDQTPETVGELLHQLEGAGLVELYGPGRKYGWIPGWKHQRIEKPSKQVRYPTPDQFTDAEYSPTVPGAIQKSPFSDPEYSGKGVGGIPEHSGSIPGALPVGARIEELGSGTRNEELGRVNGKPSVADATSEIADEPDQEPERVEEAENIRTVYDHYKTVWGKTRYELTDKRRQKIKSRLKEHGLDGVLKAIDNSRKDDWKDRHKHNDLADNILHSYEQCEKWINAKPKGKSGGGYTQATWDDDEEAGNAG